LTFRSPLNDFIGRPVSYGAEPAACIDISAGLWVAAPVWAAGFAARRAPLEQGGAITSTLLRPIWVDELWTVAP